MSLNQRLINTSSGGIDYSNFDISQISLSQKIASLNVENVIQAVAEDGNSIWWAGYTPGYQPIGLTKSVLGYTNDLITNQTPTSLVVSGVVTDNDGYEKLAFSADGYVAYTSEIGKLTVIELSTPFDILSYVTHYLYTWGTTDTAEFNGDGSIMYLKSIYNTGYVKSYSTSNFVYDVSNFIAQYDYAFTQVSSGTQSRSMTITPDGRKIIMIGSQTSARYYFQIDLSTPFDLTTASYNNKYYIYDSTNEFSVLYNVTFSLDGSSMFTSSYLGCVKYDITL
jgi:hypothetical protein